MSDAAQPAADWLKAMEDVAEEDGYLDPLGPRHWAFFAETGPLLLVTFERAEAIRARQGNMPALWPLAQAQGWSLLTLIAEGETFWRAPEVWGYVDRLVDDAFFDDFDQVLFYGAGDGGYAAAAYLVAAPGARAVLVAPRASVLPAVAGWDNRHRAARRLDFTTRYGYAPEMTEGAGHVWLLHDPLNLPDAAHAALFRRPWTTVLAARRTGEGTEKVLAATKALDAVLTGAMQGSLTPAAYARAWRGRRTNPAYLRATLAAAAGHPRREIGICRSVTQRLRAPRFAQRLAELTAAAAD